MLDGRCLAMRAADRLSEGGCDRVLVVVSAEEVAALVEPPYAALWNPRPEAGMSGSLRCALEAIAADDSVVFMPVDLPGISSRIVREVVERIAPGAVVRPEHSGRRGHPVGFGPDVALRLRAPEWENARLDTALRHCGVRDIDVPTSDAQVLRDVDTPEQWRRWLAGHRMEEPR